MKHRTFALTISALALAAASFSANADILFTNLGNVAPPASIGGHAMTPFDLAPQNAIADFTSDILVIPGNPGTGALSLSRSASKFTAPYSWNSQWAGNTVGPVYRIDGNFNDVTLTLPPGTTAFYFYTSPHRYGTFNMTAVTDSGATSGVIPVLTGTAGSNGFGFYSTAGETISSVTVTLQSESAIGLGVGFFGINQGTTTCASSGYTGTKLLWCQKICESGLTGKALEDWIHRWINRYRDLPTCAAGGGGEGEGEGEGA